MAPQLIERICPVCQGSAHRELFRKESLRLVRCDGCSMIYASPVEEGWATGLFYDQLAKPYYLSADKVESDYSPVRFARELQLFRRYCRRGNVLDVGCSTGAFLHQLQRQSPEDYEGTGIDVAGPALDYAEQKGVRVLRESFLTTDFQGQTFSAVTFWAVMEHLIQPRAFFAKTASLLRRSGVCFLLVPNFQSFAVRVLGSKYRYIFPQHVNYFTLSTLKRFVANESQLRIVACGSMHFNPIVILQDWRSGGKFVSDEDRARLLRRTTGYKQNPAMKPAKVILAGIEKALGTLNLADNIYLVLEKTAT